MTGNVIFASTPVKTPTGFRHKMSLVNLSETEGIGASRLGIFELFTGLDMGALAEIAACAKESWVRSGTQVIRQGQFGKDVFLLEEGAAAIYVENAGAIELLTSHRPS